MIRQNVILSHNKAKGTEKGEKKMKKITITELLMIAELEKIKVEIEESFSSSVDDCIYIIDKHISELKGELE